MHSFHSPERLTALAEQGFAGGAIASIPEQGSESIIQDIGGNSTSSKDATVPRVVVRVPEGIEAGHAPTHLICTDSSRQPSGFDEEWQTKGACRTADPDMLFVQGAPQNRAKAVCMSCPVRTECLAEALDNKIKFGVWGGMTERERSALLRRRPNVASWRRLLETARADYERVVAMTAE